MANTKISNLPAATTPVAGTEVLPIVQSSTTAKVSIANLTVGRAVSASSYDATGATAPANGMFLTATNTLAFSTASGQVGKFLASSSSGSFEVDDSASAGYNGQRYAQVVNANTGTSAYSSVISKSLNVNAKLSAFSPSFTTTALANKAVLWGADAVGASSGTVIADFSTGTNQIQFYTGTTASPILTGYITTLGDWEIGVNNSNNGLRYLQVTNVNTGTSAYASATTRSDVQTLNLQSSSSTRSASSGVTLAGKAVLYATKASGGATSTGLTIWDNSTNPQIDFVVGTSYVGTVDFLGNWDLYTRALQAGRFTPTSSSFSTNCIYYPSANTISITNNSAVTASFTSANNFDVGTGNPTNGQRYIQTVNRSTGSSAFSTVNATSDVQTVNIQAYSSTYPVQSGITVAGKAALYAAGGAGSSGLTIWDNSAAPTIQFVVGSTSAGTISSGAVFTLTNNPVLSGGTANGVAYLNGSKVLTTGTALVFDGTNLGVGTNSPASKLHVANAGLAAVRVQDTTNSVTTALTAYNGFAYLSTYTNHPMVFEINNAEKMRLDTAGNLGLGVTPSAWLSSFRSLDIGTTSSLAYFNSGTYVYNNTYYNTGGTQVYKGNGYAQYYSQNSSGAHVWGIAANNTNGANYPISSFTQAMTLDASGNLLVGQTSSGVVNINGVSSSGSAGSVAINHINGTGSGSVYMYYGYNGATIGSITQNGTTGVLYNLTSDYRLKNDQQPLTGAKEFVMALQPKKWQWWDGSGEGVGFIAHEFMEVAKYSGQGEKDAVEIIEIKDEDGNVTGTEERPIYQSIQPSSSEVMANLVAHIQELETRLAALEAK